MKDLWVLPCVLAVGCDAGFGPEISVDGIVGAGGTGGEQRFFWGLALRELRLRLKGRMACDGRREF